jgi:hypothetical protein
MGLPDFLTVEEAAAVVRIGRSAAYELARRYRVTGGAEGVPVIVLGRLLRVPRAQLEVWAGGSLGEPEARTTGQPPSRPSARAKRLRPVSGDAPSVPPVSR